MAEKLNNGSSDDHKMSCTAKAKIYSMFSITYPADILLWRNKKTTASLLGLATAVWALFELLQYHLLTLVCHTLILALLILIIWSCACTLTKKSLPKIPEVRLPEDIVLSVAGALRTEINGALAFIREIAVGKDVKKILIVIVGLWVVGTIGSCCSFLTLCYISFLLLHTMPVIYEKYEDKIGAFAKKAEAEIKKAEAEIRKQYTLCVAEVMSRIPKGLLKQKYT